MRVHVAPVAAKSRHNLFASFTETLAAGRYRDALVRAGFAYATLGGVQQFLHHATPVAEWEGIRKQFLIGIHHAITEPSALETLRGISNAELRVYIPGGSLRIEALYSRTVFHPKVLAISRANGRNVRLLQAGSPNMTAAAIAELPENYEFSIALQSEGADFVDREGQFDAWWSIIWDRARPVDRTLIRRYAELRKRVLDRNPILRFTTEAPASIGEADYFFAEVGAGSGPPGWRHQIEFPESLARFFGPLEHNRRPITLMQGRSTWPGRPLSYKLTTFGVGIWRLGMPTQHTGGEPIAGRAIRFIRTLDEGTFEFEVVDADSDEFREWMRLANLSGHLGTTRGQGARQYGFY